MGHGRSSLLLTVLGKLSIKQNLWGKARSYLETSIDIEPSAEAYLLLAKLLEEKMHEPEKAQTLYQKGLEAAVSRHTSDDILSSLNAETIEDNSPSLKVIQ